MEVFNVVDSCQARFAWIHAAFFLHVLVISAVRPMRGIVQDDTMNYELLVWIDNFVFLHEQSP